MANIWVIIGGIAAIIGALIAIAKWLESRILKMNAVSFDKGKHHEKHEKIATDIGNAHRRLDTVEENVADLRADRDANIEVHNAIIRDVESLSSRVEVMGTNMNVRLDKILEILVNK